MTDKHIAAPADDKDKSEHIIATLGQAREQCRPVYISAGGSKRHLVGRDCDSELLDVSGHRGIVDYQPQELVITARSGTPLSDVIETLAEHNQILPFDPPLFSGKATLGGTLACNLSGPVRPFSGSIRDAVLGVQLINGKCERLNFGGKVMKNVAGYDVSRLQAGALGTLGVLTEVSLKVLPRTEKTMSLRYEMSAQDAIETMNRRAGEPKPLSGAFWVDDQLYLRLSGAASAVDSTVAQWGGERLPATDTTWENLRDMTLPYFASQEPLWRFSINPTTPVSSTPGSPLIDWCGAQRWVRGEHPHKEMQLAAVKAGGHVTLFSGGDRNAEVRSPLSAVEQRLQLRLKTSFDPDGILNPGRLYSWL